MKTRDAARAAIAEIEGSQGPEQIATELPKDQLMEVARQFAKILLQDAAHNDPEVFANAFDTDAVLDALVARVRERSGHKRDSNF